MLTHRGVWGAGNIHGEKPGVKIRDWIYGKWDGSFLNS